MFRKQQSAKESRQKQVKPNERVSQKRVESAQESNKPRDRDIQLIDNVSKNDQVEEKLYLLVSDYLLRGNFLKTLETFQQDVDYSQKGSKQEQSSGTINLVLQSFDSGLREQFMSSWNKLIPQSVRESDHETRKLEFYLQIYFLIYLIHPNTPKIMKNKIQEIAYRESMVQFKIYLDSRGMDLSKTSEVLNFYALAYIEQPQSHPAFEHLFQYQWLIQLRNKLSQFLTQVLGNKQEESMLKNLYLQKHKNGGNDQELQKYSERLESLNKQLQTENNEQKSHILQQKAAFQQLSDGAKTDLMESQQKWFQLTRDLAMISKDFLKMIDVNMHNQVPFSEQQIDHLRKKLSQYEKFLNSNIDDLMSQSQDISLFEKADQEQSNILAYNPNLAHQTSQNQTQQQHPGHQEEEQQIIENNMIPLDFGKIIKLFTTSNNYILVTNVLQALRWRITKPKNAYERRSVVVAYATHDIIGTHQRNILLAQYLLLKAHPKIQEFTLKLLNALASDYSGRTYLTQNSQLVRFLTEIVKKESGDTVKRKNAIGALQKLSLRKQAQVWMIEHDLIHQILLVLKNEKDTLSEYCYEYITALLMNLSLRSAGKDKLEQSKDLAFGLFLSLLECPNDQIRTFINGTLYSLLSRKSFQDYANSLNLLNILTNLYEEAGERFQKQIMYMIELLRKEKADDDVEDTISDQVEENDVDDIDDEEECMAEDEEDEEQISDLSQEMIIGEELLCSEFALVGAEAEKQKFITDSIVLKELQERALYNQQHLEQQQQQQHEQSDDEPSYIFNQPQHLHHNHHYANYHSEGQSIDKSKSHLVQHKILQQQPAHQQQQQVYSKNQAITYQHQQQQNYIQPHQQQNQPGLNHLQQNQPQLIHQNISQLPMQQMQYPPQHVNSLSQQQQLQLQYQLQNVHQQQKAVTTVNQQQYQKPQKQPLFPPVNQQPIEEEFKKDPHAFQSRPKIPRTPPIFQDQ